MAEQFRTPGSAAEFIPPNPTIPQMRAAAQKCRHCGEWLFCSRCGGAFNAPGRFCQSCGQTRQAVTLEVAPSYTQTTVLPGPPPAAPIVYQPSAPPGIPTQYGQTIHAAKPIKPYADFGQRFGAWLIDAIIFFVILGVLASTFHGRGVWIAVIAQGLYFTILNSSKYQGTLGKQALGLIVTDVEGRRIGFGRATARFFAELFITNPLAWMSFGATYWMAGFTEKTQALHDMIAGTLVLDKKRAAITTSTEMPESARRSAAARLTHCDEIVASIESSNALDLLPRDNPLQAQYRHALEIRSEGARLLESPLPANYYVADETLTRAVAELHAVQEAIQASDQGLT